LVIPRFLNRSWDFFIGLDFGFWAQSENWFNVAYLKTQDVFDKLASLHVVQK
jgi:hypothetical protein